MIDDEKQIDENNSTFEQTPPRGLLSLSQLMDSDENEKGWVVEGLLKPGLYTLNGDQKVGKSILALTMAISIAVGEKFLGEFSTTKGTVIYLSLEDGQALMKEKLERMLGTRKFDRNKKIDLFMMMEYKLEKRKSNRPDMQLL